MPAHERDPPEAVNGPPAGTLRLFRLWTFPAATR